MAAPDPVDIRLLSLVAESGKAAVHDIAARLGMDPREVATRLVNLSAAGLPLIVGVECDPYGLRNAIAGAWSNHPPQGPYPPRGYPAGPPPAGPPPGGPSGPHPVAGPPMTAPPPRPPARPDPMSTWGPPQSSSWARGDQPTRPATWTAPPAGGPGTSAPVMVPAVQRGHVGDTLHTDGTECEPLAIRLVELVDPADFLFTAAGYRLREGERAVVVHTEVTNQGTGPFTQLPDLYLVLVAKDGQTVGKAPVSLSSRPPHRMGVRPGETTGGHTVYVLPDATELAAIRWTFTPDDERGALTWDIEP